MENNLLPVLWRPSDPRPVSVLLQDLPPVIKSAYFTEVHLRHCDDCHELAVVYGIFSFFCVGPTLALFISFDVFDTGKSGYWFAVAKFLEDERRASYVG